MKHTETIKFILNCVSLWFSIVCLIAFFFSCKEIKYDFYIPTDNTQLLENNINHGKVYLENTNVEKDLNINYNVVKWSMYYNIPESIILAVIDNESSGNPFCIGENSNGTYDFGIMQINSNNLINTQFMKMSLYENFNPFIISHNIQLGAAFLKELYNQFGTWRIALAAYNAGPTRVTQLIKNYGTDYIYYLPARTINYVKRILS